MEEVVLVEKSVINSIINLIGEGSSYRTSWGNINTFLNLLQNLKSYSKDEIKIKDRDKIKKVKKPEMTTSKE